MTDRIDHAAEARQHIDWAHEEQSVEGSWEYSVRDYALIAQAEATLALVEQQRIANLVALTKNTFAAHEAREALSTFATAKFGEQIGLRPDIAAALGIEAVDHG